MPFFCCKMNESSPKTMESGHFSSHRFPPWLSFVIVGVVVVSLSFVLVYEANLRTSCYEKLQQEKPPNSSVQDLYWVSDPPVYADNETWLKGWFPEKTLPDGPLKVTPEMVDNSFFWHCFNKYYKKRWVENISDTIVDLQKWLLLDPPVGLNKTCLPPPLIEPKNLQCKKMHPYANFTGKIREKPRKIGISFKYGFETDMLELHLMEVYDVVDKIFLVETMRTHYGNTPKPLFWEKLKWTPRFRRFQDKVVHFVMDDLSFQPGSIGGKQEAEQERARFNLIVEWNRKFKYFDDDDLIAMGDCDEIVSRNVIHALKYCEIENLNVGVDAAIWFVHQTIQATQVGYAAISKISPYSLGSPTFHSFRRCNTTYDKGDFLTREKGRNKGHAIAGGIHLSWYPNPFQLLMKRVTCSECRFDGPTNWTTFSDLKEFSEWLIFSKPWKTFWLRYPDHEVRGTGDPTEFYPWAMVCNPYRYRASVFLTNDERLFFSRKDLPFDTC